MGTPAFIGKKNENGDIIGIYCHNGHLKHLGPMLQTHYNNGEAVAELIKLGNLSCVRDTIEMTEAYIRDLKRSSNSNRAKLYKSLFAIKEDGDGTYYAYFVFADGEWYVSERGNYLTLLDNALSQMNEEC
jgi:hypothetical protein